MHKRTIQMSGLLAALALALPLIPASGSAAVGKILRLQGRLVSQAGTPVPDGDYGVTIRFYKGQNDATADSLLPYIDPGVKVKGGLFSITIGEASKLDPKSFFSGAATWMGMKVGSDDELPRLPLHQVAYAFRAEHAADLACTGCVSASDIDPKVLEPYAKKADLHKVATSGKFEDLVGAPDLIPYAKSADLHKIATTGKYTALEGKPPLADLSLCKPGEVLQGYKPDGKAICAKDQNNKYSGKDFALSNMKCPTSQVVRGFSADGKPQCVLDQKGESTGKDFALSNQQCPPGQVSKGTAANGKPVCVTDQNTKYTGKDFAKSNAKCPANKVVQGFDAKGAVICVADQKGQSSGKDFALSNQKCASGQVQTGVDTNGKPLCAKDKDTLYSGKNFALANQACSAGQVLRGVNNLGKKVCVSDKDTKYTGKHFALADQACSAGQMLRGIDSSGKKVCTKVAGNSHNHNYDVNNVWLRENGQNAPFKAHGGKHQVVMRTDGAGQYANGIGDYPFVWMYGGDVSSNRRMLLDKDGQLWTSKYGWLHSRFAAANKNCPSGQVMAGVLSNGNPKCVVDQNSKTVYKAGTGLSLGSNTFSLNLGFADGRYVNEKQTNAITSAMIKDGQVTSADVANESLTGSDIKNGSVASADVKDNSLTSSDVLNGSLTGTDVKDSSLTGSDVANESLTGSDIKNGSLTYSDTNVNSIQRRVASSCPAGQAIRVINNNGTVSCVADVGSDATKYAGSVVKGNWYRIASTGGGHEVSATFTVAESSYNSIMRFRAGVSSGDAGGMAFTLENHSYNSTQVFDKVRVLEGSSSSTHHLDVKFSKNTSVWFYISSNHHEHKWVPQKPKILGTSDTVGGYSSRIYAVNKIMSVGDHTERLSVLRGGNVLIPASHLGIGTSASYPLHVTRPISNWQARFTNGKSNVYLNHSTGHGIHINNGQNDSSSKYLLEARNNKGAALYVRGDRRVGINTSSPAEALHVNGSIRGGVNGALRVSTGHGYLDVGPQNTGHAHLQTDRATFYFNKPLRVDTDAIGSYNEDLLLQTAGTSRIHVNKSTGNVGIAYSPDSTWRLKVNGKGYFSSQLRTDDWLYPGKDRGIHWHSNQWGGSGDYANIQYYRDGGGENTKLRFLINNDADDDIEFYQAGAARMNIYNGNVGIGYPTPDWKLKVAGNGYFSSTLRFDGALQADGKTVIDDGGGWHRSYGKTGWYNGTYGGGIYQEDSTYVRVYNGKKFRADWGIYIGTTHVAKGNQICPAGQVMTGFNSSGNKVCSSTTGSGTIYTRWGRNSCNSGATLVYWGWAGGSHYTHGGSGSNLLCLRRDPTYLNFNVGNHDGGLIYGVEFEVNNNAVPDVNNTGEHDNEVGCAVCWVPSRNAMFMQPGNYSCPSGWTREYYGYLMSERHNHTGRGTYVCVDRYPQTLGSNTNHNGALLYTVEAECGSLKCGPNKNGYYTQNKELSCAVCTR